jgi:hypothetical protein
LRDSVALDRAGIRLVVPLEAIESVHVARDRRPTAAIRLNSTASKAPPTILCTIGSRNTEEMEAFARAVNAALPQRDKTERCVDGAALVKAEKRPFTSTTTFRPIMSPAQARACGVFACLAKKVGKERFDGVRQGDQGQRALPGSVARRLRSG